MLRISWNFQSKSWSNPLDSPHGSFSQVTEHFSCPFQAYFSNVLFDRFPSKLSLTTKPLAWKCCLKWYKTAQWALYWCFWMILLPWNAKETICLALIRYFSQNMELIPGRFWFCIFFFTFFVFFEIFVSNIFWKYLNTCWFSGKSYENMFCSKFTKLSAKIQVVKISWVLPVLCLKSQSHFFANSLFLYFSLKLTDVFSFLLIKHYKTPTKLFTTIVEETLFLYVGPHYTTLKLFLFACNASTRRNYYV